MPLVVWLVCSVLLLRFFIPRLGKVSEEQADARSLMTGRIVDSYANIQTVKLFSHARREATYARESMAIFMDTVYRSMRLVTSLYGFLYLINSLLLFSVSALSIWLWLGDAVSIGAVAVVIGLVLRLWGMSQWIMWEMSALFENIGTVQDGISSISLPRVVDDKPGATELVVPKGGISFEDVRFDYGKQKGVIERLTLDVRPGEKVGVVGRSGAGKSTLVNLLLRFYDIEGGRILIDGQDISAVTQDSLRAQIGVVTQDTSLLHRSVRENILYGRPDAGDEMMIEAARRAETLDFVKALSDPKGRKGFDAHVGWDFAVGRSEPWQAGPSIGYLHVVQPDDTLRPEDARLFTVGAHVAWGQRSGTCGDQDGDGICDARDACPGVAGPASGNEAIHGCPRSDRDRDSIYDDEDACPDESGPRSSDPKKNGCPRADRDGDAVYDDEDACPEEPGVRTHNPKTNGCPPSDRDSDGVFDDEDACPDAAGVRTTDKATNGCAPLTSTIRLVGDRLVLDDRIHFDTDSPRVRSKSFPLLRRVAEFLNASPDILHVDIEGHADRVGADDYNLGLSRARAASVRTLLIGAGVSESRLSARGYGESRPKTKVDTGRGSVEDRRVEFWVVRCSPRTESVGEKP